MIKKIKNLLYILTFLTFIFLIGIYYFSENNIVKVNKNRSIYPNTLASEINNLIILKNDTVDIILYRDDIKEFKKNKKKYTFWDLIKKIN
tara:strand:+ start:692 stop:961 length:270 start_codon:yes stop_codon:yes gene_type:complete